MVKRADSQPPRTPKSNSTSPLRVFLLTLIVFAVAAALLVLLIKRPPEPHRVRQGDDVIRVLFIGNSYTYVNNLPGLLIELSAHEAKPVDAEMVAVGGATLYQHWSDGNARLVIQRGGWDYVVLQEQSTLGSSTMTNGVEDIGNPALFHEYVRRFNEDIEKVGAKTLLYMTWARQYAPQQQSILTKAYTDIADELRIMVAPVGLAWQRASNTVPQIVLYQDDGSHPAAAGSYLAACVFYAVIYGKSPEGLPAHIVTGITVDDAGVAQSGEVNLSPSDALTLQQIAWQIVSKP